MTNTNRYQLFRSQYARGAKGLESMLSKATRTGKRVGGYTADQLTVLVADYHRLATLSDADMRAHLCQFAEGRFDRARFARQHVS